MKSVNPIQQINVDLYEKIDNIVSSAISNEYPREIAVMSLYMMSENHQLNKDQSVPSRYVPVDVSIAHFSERPASEIELPEWHENSVAKNEYEARELAERKHHFGIRIDPLTKQKFIPLHRNDQKFASVSNRHRYYNETIRQKNNIEPTSSDGKTPLILFYSTYHKVMPKRLSNSILEIINDVKYLEDVKKQDLDKKNVGRETWKKFEKLRERAIKNSI